MKALLSIFLLLAITANAANRYVRRDASGAATGANWTDAFTTMSVGSLTRGDTYYIADGNYPGGTWNTAASGTTLITVKKATVADHGTSTGWSDGYGDGQAIFTNAITIATDYWYLDGQVGDYASSTPYGFKISTSVNGAPAGIGLHFYNGGQGSTARHIEIAGPNQTTNEYAFTAETTGCTSWTGAKNILISHCDINGFTTGFDSVSDWIIEYCYIRNLRSSNAGTHENVYYCGYGTTNVHFRYNHASNYDAEGFFMTYFNGSPRDIYIYGNTFTSGGDNAKGVIFRADGNFTNIYVFNNSFGPLTGLAIYNQTGESGHYTTNCYVTNNLTFGSSTSLGDLLAGYNTNAVSNPWVNYTNGNWNLTASIPGIALASQYNTDPNGVTRGADGVWDVGAVEYSGTNPPASSGGNSKFGTIYLR